MQRFHAVSLCSAFPWTSLVSSYGCAYYGWQLERRRLHYSRVHFVVTAALKVQYYLAVYLRELTLLSYGKALHAGALLGRRVSCIEARRGIRATFKSVRLHLDHTIAAHVDACTNVLRVLHDVIVING